MLASISMKCSGATIGSSLDVACGQYTAVCGALTDAKEDRGSRNQPLSAPRRKDHGDPAFAAAIVVATLILPVAVALIAGGMSALGWNIFGILDLVNAVTMGITTALAQPTSNTSPLLSYPLVLVPAFGVPLSLILHGLSIRQLRRRVITRSAPGRGSNLQAVEAA